MNILTDILSLIRQQKFSNIAEKDDVLVLGKWNEQPDMTGVASPIPYKAVKLIKIKDLKVGGSSCEIKNTPENVRSGVGVFQKTTTDPDTGECISYLRTLKSVSSNLTLTLSGDDDFIELFTDGEPNTAENVGKGVGVYKDKVGESLRFRSLTSGSGITISGNGDEIQISSSGGSGLESVQAGTNITIDNTDPANPIISSTGGDQTSAINVGGGQEVFESEIGDQLRFRTLVGGNDISVQTKGDTISISNSTIPPKVFRALLSQASDTAPVITVLENTTDFTLSVARDQAGTYQFDFSPAVADANKIAITVSQTGKSGPQLFNVNSISDEDFSLQTFAGSSLSRVDGQLLKTPLEILVYP